MSNLLDGFRRFQEDGRPDAYVATVKQQLHVPKALWFGMPVTVSNTKIGSATIREPRVFYVTEFDDEVVTIKSVPNPMYGDEGNDPDGEVSKDDDRGTGDLEFTIPRKDFYELLEPPNFQGADYQTAAQNTKGGF